ncbi:MAG: hypothetical protein FWC27_05495 [Firmicutes bacterium]|nr:hypothetical protein [Bacillota bacterium]
MTDNREIARLRSLGLNNSQIAESLGASRTTVIHTMQRAAAQGLDWQAAENLSDREIAVLLFPGGEGVSSYKAPDYALCASRADEARDTTQHCCGWNTATSAATRGEIRTS